MAGWVDLEPEPHTNARADPLPLVCIDEGQVGWFDECDLSPAVLGVACSDLSPAVVVTGRKTVTHERSRDEIVARARACKITMAFRSLTTRINSDFVTLVDQFSALLIRKGMQVVLRRATHACSQTCTIDSDSSIFV